MPLSASRWSSSSAATALHDLFYDRQEPRPAGRGKAKPNADRSGSSRDAGLPSIERMILSPAPIYDEFETLKLSDSLAQLQEEFGDWQETRWILAAARRRTWPATSSPGPSSGRRSPENAHGRRPRGRLPVPGPDDQAGPARRPCCARPAVRASRRRSRRSRLGTGARIAQAMFKLEGTSIPRTRRARCA